jgi:hypothetical protein
LANRVTAFNLFRIIDKNENGFLSQKDFLQLLEACAFDISKLNKIETMKKELKCALTNLPNEFLEKEQNLFRFRLFELLYLERCAIY